MSSTGLLAITTRLTADVARPLARDLNIPDDPSSGRRLIRKDAYRPLPGGVTTRANRPIARQESYAPDEHARHFAEANEELRLQAGLLQHLPVSAWTLKPDGTPDFVNRVWLEFSGQTLEFVRSNPEAWMTAIHPEDRERASREFWNGIRSGQGFAVETRSLRAQDGVYRWHLQQAVAMRDADGAILKFVGTTTDIDDQKRAEESLRQAQGDLARINRVTTMGELAASLAHELGQPISGANTNTDVCLRTLDHDQPDLAEVRAAIARTKRDMQRAAEILARIRSHFEKNSLKTKPLDANEMISETIALLKGEISRHNISIRTRLAADLPEIEGDRVQLRQVVMNLIVNSIEALKDVDGAGEIVIQSQRGEDEEILITCTDNGPGFPKQLAERMFDPFFTTKTCGTGMGLRISRSIIESHGGRLWAESVTGHGATFRLALPALIPEHKPSCSRSFIMSSAQFLRPIESEPFGCNCGHF